ncbi:hypothetical protein D3C76_907220 [compost metagenome]
MHKRDACIRLLVGGFRQSQGILYVIGHIRAGDTAKRHIIAAAGTALITSVKLFF